MEGIADTVVVRIHLDLDTTTLVFIDLVFGLSRIHIADMAADQVRGSIKEEWLDTQPLLDHPSV